jgi:transglutaminase-like putative cysteine protease
VLHKVPVYFYWSMPIFVEAPLAGISAWMGQRAPLLSGEPGTKQTIDLMRQLIDEAVADQKFVRFAVDLVRNVPAYNDLGEALAVYKWVQSSIRFTKDPVTKEKLYPPQELLKIRAGDCDDISMLMAALLIAIGYPARLITLAANPASPDDFSHVYVEGEVPPGSGGWIPMDAARSDAAFGVAPPTYSRKRAWSLTDDSYQDLGRSQPRRALSGYPRFAAYRGPVLLGDDASDALIAQSVAELPAIMYASQGVPVSSSNVSPYGTYTTGYTPGAGVPPAGYQIPQVSASLSSSSMLPLLLIGGAVLAVMMMGGKKS